LLATILTPNRDAPEADLALTKAPRRKLAESVGEQLAEAVKDLPAGTRVPSERELMKSLGVGRSTVREALNGLALLGLVEIRHGQGVFVAERPREQEIGPSELDKALMKGVTHDFIEARLVVEVEVVRLAAERRTDADLQRIKETIERLEALEDAPTDEALEPATQFNQAVADAAHNEVLAGMIVSFIQLMVERGPDLYERDGFREWDVAEHTGIYEAIAAGDPELAATRMRDHIVAIDQHYHDVGSA
jgi:GntR family transcriptional regulator, transcriptional repressor for pyruvate dehydrogenase complex